MRRLHVRPERTIAQGANHAPERVAIPVRRNRPRPLDSRVLHRHVGVKPSGDGMADERAPLLQQQLDQALLLREQRIELGRLAVEKGRDRALFLSWWNWEWSVSKQLVLDAF